MDLEDAADEIAERHGKMSLEEEMKVGRRWAQRVGFDVNSVFSQLEAFMSTVIQEDERIKEIKRNRDRIHTVLVKENDRILKARQKFEDRQRKFAQRLDAMKAKREEEKQEMKRKAEEMERKRIAVRVRRI